MSADTTSRVDDLVIHTAMAPGRTGTNVLSVQIRGPAPSRSGRSPTCG